MHRRRLLALCGAGLACLAGCAGGSTDSPDGNPSDGTETPTETPTATQTPADLSLSVELDALQPGIVRLATPDSLGIAGNGQYLFLRVSVEAGTAPDREDFAFRFDGEEYAPSQADGARDLYRLYGNEEARYDADSGEGWVLFELPETGDAAGAGLVWSNGVWQPGAQLRKRLAEPVPPLSVEWSPPETVTVGSEPAVSITVTNEGDLPGRFVAGLNRIGGGVAYAPVEAISRPVPAGETVSIKMTDTFGVRAGAGVGDDEPDVTYRLRLPEENRKAQIRIVAG